MESQNGLTAVKAMDSLGRKMFRMYLFIVQESKQPGSRRPMTVTGVLLTKSRDKKVLPRHMSRWLQINILS